MPRRNRKRRAVMICSSCEKRIPTAYAKTHIDRCIRARNKRKSLRHTKYSKGEQS